MISKIPPRTDRPRSRLRRRLTGALAALLLVLAAPLDPAPAAAQTMSDEAAQHVQSVGDDVVTILQDPELQDSERVDRLIQALNEATDVDFIARLVLGQYWRTASEAQRTEYLDLFRGLLMSTIADRISDYGGETFEITRSVALNERDSMVTTNIVRPAGGPPLRVDWRVRATDGRFEIIDVIVEGVSLVVTQRSEFNAVVSREGFDGLIAQLKKRIENPA